MRQNETEKTDKKYGDHAVSCTKKTEAELSLQSTSSEKHDQAVSSLHMIITQRSLDCNPSLFCDADVSIRKHNVLIIDMWKNERQNKSPSNLKRSICSPSINPLTNLPKMIHSRKFLIQNKPKIRNSLNDISTYQKGRRWNISIDVSL
jgi:hypothetical protein